MSRNQKTNTVNKHNNNAIIIIDLIEAPDHIIIIGPSATFGKLLIIVKYGSITLAMNLLPHIIVAITIPKIL